MKDIPSKYEMYGYTFTLLFNRGMVAIYEQRKGDVVRYEVVKIQEAKEDYEPYGVKAGDLCVPTANQWGKNGWTFLTLEAAKAKANKL